MTAEPVRLVHSVSPAIHILTPKAAIAKFLDIVLPADLSVGDDDQIKTFDRAGLETLLIERAPFYFIERAVVINGTDVLGVADMTAERCAGHFPGRPIVPLIELCKAMAQTGIILVATKGDSTEAPIAIGAGESDAVAQHLIKAPARILIKISFKSKFKLHFGDGTAYLDGSPIGTLKKIKYVLVGRDRLLSA